jgi:hypothetical protein
VTCFVLCALCRTLGERAGCYENCCEASERQGQASNLGVLRVWLRPLRADDVGLRTREIRAHHPRCERKIRMAVAWDQCRVRLNCLSRHPLVEETDQGPV